MRTQTEIMKAEKLSMFMLQAIRCFGQRNGRPSTGTTVALINRGILTPATSRTLGRHLLTDKGAQLYSELFGGRPHLSTTEADVVADTTVFAVGDRVVSTDDGRTGAVKQERPSRTGQLLVVRWDGEDVVRPLPAALVRPEQLGTGARGDFYADLRSRLRLS